MQISGPIDEGGLRPRTMLLLVAGLVLLVLATAFVAGREQRSRYQAEMDVRLRTLVMQRANILSRTLEDWRAQIRFLALAPSLSGLPRADTEGGADNQEGSVETPWRRRLETIFNGFAQARPGIVRVSYLSIINRRVLAAVDTDEGLPAASERLVADLQQIGKVSRLEPGGIHVDDMDAGRAGLEPSITARPLLRLSTLVAGHGGVPFGVLVVTVDARALLADLQADMNPIFRIYLLDGHEHFLLHPDPARSFATARGQPWRWPDEFKPVPEADSQGPSDAFDGPDGRVHAVRQRVMIDGAPGRHLTVAASVSDQLIAANANTVRLWVAGLGLPLTGLVALLLMLGHQARRRVRAIRARDAWLGALIHSARDAIIGLAPDGRVTSWNEAAAQLFGLTAAEAVGSTTQSLIMPPGLEIQEQDLLVRVGGGDSVVNLRTRRRAREGRLIDVSVTATPVRAGNRIVGTALVIRDITEQLAAETGLRGMTTRLEQQVRERTMEIEALAAQRHVIMDGMGAAIVACDPAGTITLFNPAAEAMLGHAPREVVGKATPSLFLDPAELAARAATLDNEQAAVMEILAAGAQPGRADIRPWTCIRRDGSRLPALCAVTAARDGDGTAAGYLFVALPLPAQTVPVAAAAPVEPARPVPPRAPSMPAAGAIPGIDLEEATGRVLGNRALLDSVLDYFAGRYDGVGRELDALLAAGDTVAAARKLHEFRGSAGNIAARRAMDMAAALEDGLRNDPGRDRRAELAELDQAVTELCAAIRARPREMAASVTAGSDGPLDIAPLRAALRSRRLTASDALDDVASVLTRRLGTDKFLSLSRMVDGLRYEDALALLDAEFPG